MLFPKHLPIGIMASLLDNTLLTANNLGVLSGAEVISDTFDATDSIAFYRFTLTRNSDLGVLFSGESFTDVRLIVDSNGNGIVENNEIVAGRSGSNFNFFEPLPVGNYFLRVQTFNNRTEAYTLRIAPTPKPGNVLPDPGSTLGQSFNLGVLSRQRVLRDYVGPLDAVDAYRFTLVQTSNIGVLVNGLTQSLPIQIVADRNRNGVVDSGETIASRLGSNITFSETLSPGTYFAIVGNASGSWTSQYTLTFNPVPDFSGNDVLRGTVRADAIRGFGGNDVIFGFGGDDRLLGDADSDRLFGGFGNDRLFGGTGNDVLVGEFGNDVLIGEAGVDILSGGFGNDTFYGGTGNDVITTGGGFDRIVLLPNQGFDRVRDFVNNVDKIDLVGIGFNQLNFRQFGTNVLVRIGNTSALLLESMNLRLIDRTDFV